MAAAKPTKITKPASALDRQVGGHHYKDCAIQPVLFLEANDFSFCQAQIIKYASRLGKKGGPEGTKKDLDKIRHYCDLYEELNKV